MGQWSRGSHVGLYFPVLIGKEIRVFSQFKHLAQGLIPVLQLLVRTCASRHQTVATVFFLQRQDTPTGPERFWRILHGTLHFTEIIQYDIVYFRGTSEEFLQVLVIGAIMSRAGCAPFSRNKRRECHSGHGWRQGSCHSRFPPCRHRRESSCACLHTPLERCNGA